MLPYSSQAFVISIYKIATTLKNNLKLYKVQYQNQKYITEKKISRILIVINSFPKLKPTIYYESKIRNSNWRIPLK